LRDQLRGKMKIEFRDQHGLSIVLVIFRGAAGYEFAFNNPIIL
jgi:hypothetical protein